MSTNYSANQAAQAAMTSAAVAALSAESAEASADRAASAAQLYVAQGGPDASRPANPVLYQVYFSTTLGYQISCKQVTPTVIWVNAAGVQV